MPYPGKTARGRSSERSQEGEQLGLARGLEPCVRIARGRPLTLMRQDGCFDRSGTPIVKQACREAQTPERRRAHQVPRRVVLLDAIAESAHVMKQEVRKRTEDPMVERRD